MIRHISLLTFPAGTPESDIDAIASEIRTMQDVVESVVVMMVARDLGLADDTATLAVIVDFVDLEGYEQYRDNPQHRELLEQRVKPAIVGRSVAQFEM